MLETTWQDVRYAIRMFIRNRTMTFAVVLTLALGIGANTAIFSVVNAVLLTPLPYSDSERLVTLSGTSTLRQLDDIALSEPEFVELNAQSRSFEHLAAYASGALNLTDIEEPERLGVVEASAGLFPALGVTPQVGRTFSAEEDLPGRDPVAVVSHRLWQRHYNSDPGLVGKAITLNGRSRTVVGVMPAGFNFPNDEVDVWMPIGIDPAGRAFTLHYLEAVGRLKPGVGVEQAKVEVQTVFSRVKEQYPEYYQTEYGAGMTVNSLHETIVKDIRPALLLILGAVAFMLLIACANVANLLLARSAGRQKEMSLRAALGASRARITRQLLTESLLLSALGGVLGLLLAVWGLHALLARSPLDPLRLHEVRLDVPMLGFTMLISLLAGLVFGLAPALQAAKTDLHVMLKEGGRGSMQSLRNNRTRTLLVVSEVALSMVLLVGAGLMIRSFMRLLNVDPGFRTENALTMRFTLPAARYRDSQQVAGFFQQVQERVGALPGVQSSAIINELPIAGGKAEVSFEIEGRALESEHDRESAIANYRMISPGYLRTMSIPLVRGRAFTEQDGRQSPAAVIINEKLARRFWADDDPVNKRIRITGGAWLPIVGVVPDIKNQGLNSETVKEIYFPYVETPFGLGAPPRTMTLVMHTTSDPASLTNPVRSVVRSIDPSLPAYKIQTLEQAVATSVEKPRFTMLLLTVFAGLALILATVGVYGVMSYSVAQRTREIGIRKALGAKPRDIFKLVMKQGVVLAAIGVTLGVIAAFALTRVMSSLLYAVSATDPITFIGIALLLTAVALLACYLPARKATKVNPMVALRHD